ncbi:MAG TPA: polysaccharide biosynthesis/export family protein [Paracoccaceae bacterium]|jgi:polysaccharide export outer membrane protein
MGQVFAFLAMLLLTTLPVLAQDDYRIKPGDTLRIEVLEDPNLNRSALVLPDGSISVPLAGSIRAGGQTVAQVQAALASQLAPNFAASPNVFVGVDRLAEPRVTNGGGRVAGPTMAIYVMGEAAKPGKYDITPGSTLLQVLAETGGFSKFAATKRIQLRRGDAVYTFNYKALEQGATGLGSTVLTAGDVIVIPQRQLFE